MARSKKSGPAQPSLTSHPELEQRLREHPGDEAAFLVYADWLQQQGDPRGELAMAQHRGDTGREQEILAAHGGFLAGLPSSVAKAGWHLGTWQSLAVSVLWEWKEGPKAVPMLASLLFDQPTACRLQELHIGFLSPRRNEKAVPALLSEAASRAFAPWLRLLRIGSDFPMDNAHLAIGDLGSLAAFERLEVLRIWGHRIEFGAGLVLPKLRELVVQTCGLSRRAFEAIAARPWPELVNLELWFGSRRYGSRCRVADLAPLLQGSTLPRLSRLALRNAEFTNELAAALCGAAILPRLRELDLSMGLLDDDGARVLLEAADQWKHLERLNVSHSYLSDGRVAELSAVGPVVEALGQKEDEEEQERYVSVAE